MRRRNPDRICADLERLGVAPELTQSISERLMPLSSELSPEAYEAMLSGVSLAFGVQGGALEDLRKTARDLDEIQHLLNAFTGELRKLDEALETLAAYALRLRTQGATSTRVVH